MNEMSHMHAQNPLEKTDHLKQSVYIANQKFDEHTQETSAYLL